MNDKNSMETSEAINIVYNELKMLARNYLRSENKHNSLQPTALVHEAYARLAKQNTQQWNGKNHFYAIAAKTMRRVLIDHARHLKAQKRGEPAFHLTLNEENIAKDQKLAVEKMEQLLTELAEIDPRQAQIVELRFYGGLTIKECSEVIQISERTINNEWLMAKAWLHSKF